MKKLCAALALSLIATVSMARADDASFPDISQKDLHAAMKAHKVGLIDCNGTKRYQKSHIPGAIDFQANKDRLGKLLPQNKQTLIVTYGAGPDSMLYRNGAVEAAALGYLNIRHYSPGISGWDKAHQAKAAPPAAKKPAAKPPAKQPATH